MSGQLPFLVVFAAGIAVIFGLAVLLIVGALVAAALLPRGHQLAERLRSFAGEVPMWGLRAVLVLDGLLFVGVVALFSFLVIKFS